MKFTVKNKTRWLQTFFVSIWTVLVVVMTGVLSYGFFENPTRIDDLILVWILMITLAIIASNYIRYQIAGQENLIINKDNIEVFNSGTWFSKRLRINYFELESVELSSQSDLPMWRKFWGIGGGKIKINYLGRHRNYGQDLTLEESKSMLKKIKDEIEKRKTNANNM